MRKIYDFLCGAMILGGLALIIGTAGASDAETIGFTTVCIQLTIGSGLMLLGMVGGKSGGLGDDY